MDLIERYLAAIGRQLPAKQAGDIMAELRDVLLSRIEDQESRLGRPLARPELEALLVDFGNPLTVAGRYRKTQHLIGPEVFPYWWATIKTMLAIVAGVYLVLIVLGVLADATEAEFKARVPSVGMVVIYLFGLITLAAAAFERFGHARWMQAWKPKNLPPADSRRRSTFTLAGEIAWNVVFLAWWLGAFHLNNWIPPELPVQWALAPVWETVRWPIAAYILAEIAADVVAIAWPGRVVANSAILAARYAYGVALMIWIFQAGHWLVVTSPVLPADKVAQIQVNFDLGMRVGIALTIVGMTVRIGLELWRLWRARQSALAVGASA